MQTVGSHLGRIANRSVVPDKGGGFGSTKEGEPPLRFSTFHTPQDMVRNTPAFILGHLKPIATCGLGEGCRLGDIYYYTPLPLNLANKQQATSNKQQATSNKQQASNKQALPPSVLAIAPPHRSGLYSTLATLEPRSCPCQIQVSSQKLTGGAPGRGRQVGRCPPKTAHFVPPKQPFLAQNGPETESKRPNKSKRLLHSMCALIAP